MALVQTSLLVLFIGASALAQTMDKVDFAECKHKGTGELLEVRISNCTELPCVFKKGDTATIEMDFIPYHSTDKVFTGATARIGEKKMRFRGIDRTPACEHIVEKETGEDIEECNLKGGVVYTYSYNMVIRDSYPTTAAKVQWKLSEGRHKTIACFKVPVSIVDA